MMNDNLEIEPWRDTQINELLNKHSQERQILQDTYDQKRQVLQVLQKAQLDTHKREQQGLQFKHDTERQPLYLRHREESEAINTKWQNRRSHESWILEERQYKERRALKTKHNKEWSGLGSYQVNERRELDIKQGKEFRELLDKQLSESQTFSVREGPELQDLKARHHKELQDLNSRQRKEQQALESRHDLERQALDTWYNKTLQDLDSQQREEWQTLEARHEEEWREVQIIKHDTGSIAHYRRLFEFAQELRVAFLSSLLRERPTYIHWDKDQTPKVPTIASPSQDIPYYHTSTFRWPYGKEQNSFTSLLLSLPDRGCLNSASLSFGFSHQDWERSNSVPLSPGFSYRNLEPPNPALPSPLKKDDGYFRIVVEASLEISLLFYTTALATSILRAFGEAIHEHFTQKAVQFLEQREAIQVPYPFKVIIPIEAGKKSNKEGIKVSEGTITTSSYQTVVEALASIYNLIPLDHGSGKSSPAQFIYDETSKHWLSQ